MINLYLTIWCMASSFLTGNCYLVIILELGPNAISTYDRLYLQESRISGWESTYPLIEPTNPLCWSVASTGPSGQTKNLPPISLRKSPRKTTVLGFLYIVCNISHIPWTPDTNNASQSVRLILTAIWSFYPCEGDTYPSLSTSFLSSYESTLIIDSFSNNTCTP